MEHRVLVRMTRNDPSAQIYSARTYHFQIEVGYLVLCRHIGTHHHATILALYSLVGAVLLEYWTHFLVRRFPEPICLQLAARIETSKHESLGQPAYDAKI